MDWQRARPKLTKVSSPSKEFPDHRIDILISPRHTESCLALLWLKRFRSSTRPLWANASCKIGLGDWRSYLLDTEHVNGVHLTVRMYACTHVRMYACTHVRMYACTDERMYACTHVRMYACTDVYGCTDVRTYARTHVPTYPRTHVRTCTYVRR